MGREPVERVALMAIHQRWADAILDGRKRVEFRKRRLADDISTVLVYATSPVSKVVGRFTVAAVVSDSPDTIWSMFGAIGVIERDAFFAYFSGTTSAVAIMVADAERFESPVSLDEMDPRPAIPQSFAYLSATTSGVAAAV